MTNRLFGNDPDDQHEQFAEAIKHLADTATTNITEAAYIGAACSLGHFADSIERLAAEAQLPIVRTVLDAVAERARANARELSKLRKELNA